MFQRVGAPSREELRALVQRIALRVGRSLERGERPTPQAHRDERGAAESDSAEQDQYQQHDQHEADGAARRVTPIPAVRPPWNHAHEDQHEDYQQYCSQTHRLLPTNTNAMPPTNASAMPINVLLFMWFFRRALAPRVRCSRRLIRSVRLRA